MSTHKLHTVGEGFRWFIVYLALIAIVCIASAIFGSKAHAQTTCTPTSTVACFGATKTTGEAPLSTQVIWSVPGAASCTAGNTPGWTGSVPASGTRTLSGISVAMKLTLACSGAPVPGKMKLDWSHDGKNSDGSAANLTGFTILYGTSATAMTQTIAITDPAKRTQTIDPLANGTWFASLKAVAGAVESPVSNVASKVVTSTPGASLPVLSVDLVPVPTPTAPILTVADVTAFEFNTVAGVLVGKRLPLEPLSISCAGVDCTVLARRQ